MAILHHDRGTGVINNQRRFGMQIQIRCWKSVDARTATPIPIPAKVMEKIISRLRREIPGVVNILENKMPKPPSTMESI